MLMNDRRGATPVTSPGRSLSLRRVRISRARWRGLAGLSLAVTLGPVFQLAGTAPPARAHPPEFDWAASAGGIDFERGRAIAVDAAGNVFSTGRFEGTADFDPGPGTFNLTSAGQSDIFVQKLDPGGNLLWAVGFGGALWDEGLGVAVDGAGNVYTTGLFFDTADFDPGPGAFYLTNAGPGSADVFVQKLDPSGSFVWAARMGGASNDGGSSIAVDLAGNVHTTGFFIGTVDFDPGVGVFNLTSVGFDVFVQKLDPGGNFLWAGNIGSGFSEGVALDDLGHVYTVGRFGGTVDFDPGPGTFNLTSAGLEDIFVHKLDPGGAFLWAVRLGGPSNDQGHGVAVDGAGNVHTTGFFRGTADFDPGPGTFNLTSVGNFDIFVQKLDPGGNLTWAVAMGGSKPLPFFQDTGLSTAVDAAGNVFTTGLFNYTVDFDPGPGTLELSAPDGGAFVQKLDAGGNLVWAVSVGGTSGSTTVGFGVAVDGVGGVCTVGDFNGTVDFDPGPGTFSLASAAGSRDIFVLKLEDVTDSDGDGVPDDLDVCPGTVIPEATVPSVRLGVNRWALVDGDTVFDTTPPPGGGGGPGLGFTVEETGGCSCEQIIDALGLGQGHVKFGCSNGAMEEWVALVNP